MHQKFLKLISFMLVVSLLLSVVTTSNFPSLIVSAEESISEDYNVPLVKTQMKKIIVTAKTLYSHPKNVSKIYAALHTDLAW